MALKLVHFLHFLVEAILLGHLKLVDVFLHDSKVPKSLLHLTHAVAGLGSQQPAARGVWHFAAHLFRHFQHLDGVCKPGSFVQNGRFFWVLETNSVNLHNSTRQETVSLVRNSHHFFHRLSSNLECLVSLIQADVLNILHFFSNIAK